MAAKLVNEDHVGVNARDDHGVPALSIAVQLRQPVLTRPLLNAVDPRVEVDAATPSRYTALHFAVGSNDRNVVKALLRRGADPNAQITQEQSGGWGPLHFACRLGHLEIAKNRCLDFDADPLLWAMRARTRQGRRGRGGPYATRKKIAGLPNRRRRRRGEELWGEHCSARLHRTGSSRQPCARRASSRPCVLRVAPVLSPDARFQKTAPRRVRPVPVVACVEIRIYGVQC